MGRVAYHRRVTPHVGRNPIARAVAQRKFEVALRDQKIRLLLSEDGEPCDEFIAGVELTLRVIEHACDYDPRVTLNAPQARVVRGGLSACRQMILAGGYAVSNTSALVAALDAAAELNTRLDPEAVNAALIKLKVLA